MAASDQDPAVTPDVRSRASRSICAASVSFGFGGSLAASYLDPAVTPAALPRGSRSFGARSAHARDPPITRTSARSTDSRNPRERYTLRKSWLGGQGFGPAGGERSESPRDPGPADEPRARPQAE